MPIVQVLGTASGCLAVLVLALYIDSRTASPTYPYPFCLWLICPVLLYWIARMWVLANRGQLHDDPVVFAVKDRTSRLCGLLALALLLCGHGAIPFFGP